MALPSIKNSVGMAVTSVASAGVGTITLGAALSGGYQTAATAYGANANIDIRIEEGDTWEVCRYCTYTHSGTTVTRGTLEDGSSGTSTRVAFTTAAKVYVVESAERITVGAIATQSLIQFVNPHAYITRASATSLSLSAGVAYVNGELLKWTSALTWSGTSGTSPLDAAQMVHWYLYSNSGTATLEGSTTAPVWDSELGYAKKTGDATRRWVFSGRVYSGTSGKRITPFTAICVGNMAEVIFEGEYVDANNGINVGSGLFDLVTAGTASTFTSFNLSYGPAHLTAAYLSGKVYATSTEADLLLGVTQSDQTAAGASDISYAECAWRAQPTNGDKVFFGQNWRNTNGTTMYYVFLAVSGSGNADIVMNGYRAPI